MFTRSIGGLAKMLILHMLLFICTWIPPHGQDWLCYLFMVCYYLPTILSSRICGYDIVVVYDSIEDNVTY